MKKTVLILIVCLAMAASAGAHTPLMSCFDEGDGTITCVGGFSDGSSSSGVLFYVEEGGKKIFETKMNEFSEVTFKRPTGNYQAVFDAGEGHRIYVDGRDIVE